MPLSAPSARTGGGQSTATTLKHPLTGQQEAIVDAVRSGTPRVVVEALAGTGKTSTLEALATVQTRRPGVYLAFNKSVQLEAEGRFPEWITPTTAHGYAYQAVGKRYGHRLPGNPAASRLGASQMAKAMKVQPALLDTGTINPVHVVRMAQATVNAYLKSADAGIQGIHIPPRCFADHNPRDLMAAVLPIAHRIWDDMQSTNGKFRFTHDAYLKMWQLTNPHLPFDYIMFDEAQDADPVISAVVNAQTNTQRIWVGDENQAIYGWRGAVNAMSKVQDATRLALTQSWRFGEAIADEANRWLDMLGSKHRVQGNRDITSTVGDIEVPTAILCRGNGTALGWVLKFHSINLPVCLAPGTKDAGKDIERFAWAAKSLMSGEGTDHPDLVGFQTWQQLVNYVEEEEDTDDLKRMVNIINQVGVSKVIDAVRGCTTADRAVVTVSTAHKAKGLEWRAVRVADDFVPPEEDVDEPDREAMMLNYVTVTRAVERIQLGALAEPELWAR
jgi:hypothetical protein